MIVEVNTLVDIVCAEFRANRLITRSSRVAWSKKAKFYGIGEFDNGKMRCVVRGFHQITESIFGATFCSSPCCAFFSMLPPLSYLAASMPKTPKFTAGTGKCRFKCRVASTYGTLFMEFI